MALGPPLCGLPLIDVQLFVLGGTLGLGSFGYGALRLTPDARTPVRTAGFALVAVVGAYLLRNAVVSAGIPAPDAFASAAMGLVGLPAGIGVLALVALRVAVVVIERRTPGQHTPR